MSPSRPAPVTMRGRRRLAGGIAAAGLMLALGGCEKPRPPFNSVDLTGADYARVLELPDHHGRARTLADFRGKLVVVFFGFTHCPDVCPTALVQWAEVRKRLGADGERVQILFVTVDPERDTPDALSRYVPAFDPSFLGLRGTPQQTAAAAREFKVFYQKVPGQNELSYTMDHTAGSYVFDGAGRIRLMVRANQDLDRDP